MELARLRRLTGIAGLLAMLLVAVATGWAWPLASTPASAGAAQGGCYELTKDCGGSKPPQPSRGGEPLDNGQPTGDQRDAVQAAIDMIDSWVANCGVTGPTPPDGGDPPHPGDFLQDLLDQGNICEEVAAENNPETAGKVGATSSNPAKDGPDSAGCTWTTGGHPGINVGKDMFPPKGSDGTFLEKGVADLAAALLHELSHLINPNNNASDKGEYEKPAYDYAVEQMCKVAGCPGVSQEVKDAMCAYIASANEELCRLGQDQACCDECPNQGKIHCEGAPPGPGGVTLFLDSFWREHYAYLDARGWIWLEVGPQRLLFDIHDFNGSRQFAFDFGSVGELDFVAVSFTSIDHGNVLVGGFSPTTGEGKVVRLTFDPFGGVIHRARTELASSQFLVASSMDALPDRVRVVFMDHVTHQVFVLHTVTGALQLVADSSMAPTLANMTYVHAWRIPNSPPAPIGPATPVPRDGTWLWATTVTKRYTNLATLIPASVDIIDQNGDGVFELVD